MISDDGHIRITFLFSLKLINIKSRELKNPWEFFVFFFTLGIFCENSSHHQIEAALRVILGWIPSDRGCSKMSAKELNMEIIEGLSEEIGSFYEKTEAKYWMSLPTEAVPEKLAVQVLFKELNRLKEHSLKPYSRVSA